MIKFNSIQDFFTKESQNIFQNLYSNFGLNFVIVFDLKNQNVISIYVCQNIVVQDEQNRKTFLIKGKLVNDLGTILQTGGQLSTNGFNINNDFKQVIDSLPISIHTYSENMFGFIGFGIQGY